jgi:hypothetical protein
MLAFLIRLSVSKPFCLRGSGVLRSCKMVADEQLTGWQGGLRTDVSTDYCRQLPRKQTQAYLFLEYYPWDVSCLAAKELVISELSKSAGWLLAVRCMGELHIYMNNSTTDVSGEDDTHEGSYKYGFREVNVPKWDSPSTFGNEPSDVSMCIHPRT